MQDSQSYEESLSIKDNDTHGFKNCSTESCPSLGLNPLKSTSIKDGIVHIIGYFCDACKEQLQGLGKSFEQNLLYEKGIEHDIGF